MEAPTAAGTIVFADDFGEGFAAEGPGARWLVRPLGGRPHGDGVPTTSPEGLVVVPSATDPATGHPCFAPPRGPGPHMRWAGLAARTSRRGLPGFDVAPHGLLVTAELAVRTYGVDRHPGATGGAASAERDVRLGAGALITLDRETGVVFDVMLTQRGVHAVYERLPRPGGGGVFSYAVPVADREPDQVHRVAVAYRPEAGRVTWHVDGVEVLAVDRVGRRCLDPGRLIRDDGGPDDDAAPAQLAAGFGLMADEPLGQGVRLAVRRVEVRAGTAGEPA